MTGTFASWIAAGCALGVFVLAVYSFLKGFETKEDRALRTASVKQQMDTVLERIEENTRETREVKAETKKTNGRVNELETFRQLHEQKHAIEETMATRIEVAVAAALKPRTTRQTRKAGR